MTEFPGHHIERVSPAEEHDQDYELRTMVLDDLEHALVYVQNAYELTGLGQQADLPSARELAFTVGVLYAALVKAVGSLNGTDTQKN